MRPELDLRDTDPVLAFSWSFLVVAVPLICGLGTLWAGAAITALGIHGMLRADLAQRLALLAGVLLALATAVPRPAPDLPVAGPVAIAGIVDRVRPLRDARGWDLLLDGSLRVRWTTRAASRPWPGDRVEGHGRLRSDARVVITYGRALRLVTPNPASWRGRLARLRAELSQRIGVGLPDGIAGLARSLLLGERTLPDDLKRGLQDTGTLHFFAVSGFHVALLMGLAAGICGRQGGALTPLVLVYALVTGLRSPVARATTLAVLTLGARRHARRERPLAMLAFAATIVLALDPQALLGVSFQLSFAAYAGIRGLALPCLERDPYGLVEPRRREKLAQIVRGSIVVTVAAWSASLPVTLAWFGQCSAGSLPGSLLLLPLMPGLMIAALLHLAVPACGVGAVALGAFGRVLEAVVRLLDRLPGTPMPSAPPTTLAILFATLAMLLLARGLHRSPPGRRTRRLLWLVPALLPLWCSVRVPAPGVHALDVGHGTALLLVDREGVARLVDTGRSPRELRGALREAGVVDIHALLVTHDHADHDGARDVVLEDHPACRDLGAVHRGRATPGFGHVLWPPATDAPVGENDSSVVLSRHGALLTGDLEARGTRALLAEGDDLRHPILLLPHHGSANEALVDLLLRASPARVWISGDHAFVAERTWLTLAWCGIESEITSGSRLLRRESPLLAPPGTRSP